MLRAFRIRAFVSTWCSYAGFYFCRKTFYVVKGDLTQELGLDAHTLANIGLVYLVAYAVGEFNAAAIGSRIGARRLLLAGMGISLACNAVFGFANNAWTFMAFMALNGLAQATGWSGNVGTMANWFRQAERGRVMGVWATCYQIGGALAKGFAAFILGVAGWRYSFWAASLVLTGVWFLFYALQRNRPEDVGLAPISDTVTPRDDTPQASAAAPVTGFNRPLLVTILMMGSFYFFIKFIRYALWSWTPYFLQLSFGLAHDNAGYFSTLFDLFGFVGVLAAGWASDRLFQGRRAAVAFMMMVGLFASTVMLYVAGAHALVAFGIAYSLTGFMLYGPDSLISGAGAIDVGSRKYALAAAGIINGMGSVGSAVQELVIGNLFQEDPSDLTRIFLVLVLSAAIATALLALLWRRARLGLCNL
ncbi:MAG: MFS transporter [Deltaproteobacteria bacterium]|nr:MFS transporter [Deltaproteobacteria bacterium]